MSLHRLAVALVFSASVAVACGAGRKSVKTEAPLAVPTPTATPYVGQERKLASRDREELHILQVNAAVANSALENAQRVLAQKYQAIGRWDVDLDQGILRYLGPENVSGTAGAASAGR